MDPQDPEERVAELERRLSEAKAAARRTRAGFGGVGPYVNDPVPEQFWSASSSALAPAPRRIPFRFLLAEVLPFRWWYLFALFLIAIPPIIVWIMKPALFLPAAVLALVAIYAIHVRGAWTRFALLKWGQVATVTDAEVVSQGTYYGGTTYSNVVLPVANGWSVTRPVWSGPKIKTRIRYQLDGYQGELTVGGREYIDGVILADQRKPERARCVTFFPYDLDRDDTGNWVGRLRARLLIGMVCWLLVMIGWVGGAAVLFQHYQAFLAARPVGTSGSDPGMRAPTHGAPMPLTPGQTVVINGANETRSIGCDGNDVTVNGSANRVDITGHCASLTVSGSENQVSVDAADAITANGRSTIWSPSTSAHL